MTMPKRSFSIAWLMAVVFLVAADFGIVRAALETIYAVWLIAILPTINLMILGLPRLRRGRPGRSFWIGFEVFGGLMVVALSLVHLKYDPEFSADIVFLITDRFDWLGRPDEIRIPLLILGIIFVSTTPQLLAAWFVAWFDKRYRVTIERRGPAPEPGATTYVF